MTCSYFAFFRAPQYCRRTKKHKVSGLHALEKEITLGQRIQLAGSIWKHVGAKVFKRKGKRKKRNIKERKEEKGLTDVMWCLIGLRWELPSQTDFSNLRGHSSAEVDLGTLRQVFQARWRHCYLNCAHRMTIVQCQGRSGLMHGLYNGQSGHSVGFRVWPLNPGV